MDWVQDATKKGVKRMVAGAIQRFHSFGRSAGSSPLAVPTRSWYVSGLPIA